MTSQEVGRIVERAIARHGGDRLGLEVLVDEIHQRDDWWYVPVYPGGTEPATYEYYTVLANAEGELEEAERLNVLLVPAAAPEPA